ncbi:MULTISPECIES: helix-turn-helix domain-containing protein [Comamonas]|uniref:helix-turn-helix domain-containing protein n=1 Tax=Comamonas TaxID=283 RepID=UPI00103ED021|nr:MULTISPECIES: helix-turn-helix domain-containing protein [Comamonas]TYK71145.1 hypothetical protein FSY45_23345 [Comamonas sp. Z1]TZG08340.1 hypothetical protein FZC30_17255 [Comamonas thiooxydans]
MKKSSDTAMLPIEAEDAALLMGKKIRMARRIREMTQQHLADATQMSLNTVVKMEAGHPGVQFGFYLKALWALELIDDFTKQMGMVGINETEFALVEANLPKTVRKRSKR